jgi:NAD(P)-dependent dehydrogenase (short-subunit alcohol dehydrogenase family)
MGIEPDEERQMIHMMVCSNEFDIDGLIAVCFLASDLAGFITGAFLPVCGGNVMTSL